VLTPAEQLAAEVSYGPETVSYYNAAIHKQYPALANINQAYAVAQASGEYSLVAGLMAVDAGLVDPANHYLI